MITLNKLNRQVMLLTCLILGAILSTSAKAADFSTAIAGRVFCDANCNNQIDVDTDEILTKVTVELYNKNGQLIATTTPEVYGGTYIFPDLVVGEKYYVKVVPAYGQNVINAFPSQNAYKINTKTIGVTVVQAGETYYPNDFLLSCCTVGFNQCEWGYNSCWGFSPIDLIKNRFNQLFPNGLVIGGNKTLKFTSASAILRFLPTSNGYYPKSLTWNRVDPSSGCESEFAGNVLALALNVAVSDAGLTTQGYGDRVLPSGKFAGLTVRELLILANQVLGGDYSNLPSNLSIRDLNNTIESVNDFSSSSCGCGGCGTWNGCGGNSGCGGNNGCGGNGGSGCGGYGGGSNGCGGGNKGWKGCGGNYGGWGWGHGGGNGCGGGYGGGCW